MFFRWGNTPLDDALQFGHQAAASVLKEYLKAPREAERRRTDAGAGVERCGSDRSET